MNVYGHVPPIDSPGRTQTNEKQLDREVMVIDGSVVILNFAQNSDNTALDKVGKALFSWQGNTQKNAIVIGETGK